VPIATYDYLQFNPADLADLKGGTTITVALPAKDEASTIGPIVAAIYEELVVEYKLVDELIVIDDHSTDETAEIAAASGATVLTAATILPEHGKGHGKGEALWKSLFASTGDLITWCDADIRNYDNRFVLGVLGPLLTEPEIGFVKGFYQRPLRDDGEGGGRVTELMARPLIASLFPQLGGLVQPLSGEFGGRRKLLENIAFSQGYAVDLAMLIDLVAAYGPDVIAQVDLGARIHRNRPLRELGPQSAAILGMALRRSGLSGVPDELKLVRPHVGNATVRLGDRPPVATLSGYQSD
jgi:glucosyl-3-phosphoglycerate synthase